MMAQLRDERSLGDLFSDLSRETTTLVRQEVQLAQSELTQSATEVARGIGMLVAGGEWKEGESHTRKEER